MGILDPIGVRPQYDAPARDLGLELQFIGVAGADDLDRPSRRRSIRAPTLSMCSWGRRSRAIRSRSRELAIQHRLPSIWQDTAAVARGGLLAYAPDRADLARRAAGYVDQILKGASPADLPIQFPTKFEFVVNLKAAQALGLTVPPTVLQQATEVIQ